MTIADGFRDQLADFDIRQLLSVAESAGFGVQVTLSAHPDGKLGDPKITIHAPRSLTRRGRTDRIPRD